MPDRRAIKVVSLLVAEDVRQEIGGLQTIIGVFGGKLIVPKLPVTFPRLAVRIDFDAETTYSADILLTITNPSGTGMLRHSDHANIRHDLRNVFVVGWGPVPFKEAGKYVISFGVGDRPRQIGSFELALMQAKPEGVAQAAAA